MQEIEFMIFQGSLLLQLCFKFWLAADHLNNELQICLNIDFDFLIIFN